MIASIAMAALLALGATAALRAVLLLTQALARAEPPPSLYQGHLPAPMPTRRQERVAAVLVCVVFGAILILLAGCAPAPRSPVPEVAGLDHLQARVERLDARRTLALDAAASCERACLTGVASFSVRQSEALCACRVVASLGVHRVPKPESVVAVVEREPEELVGPLTLTHGPGAAVDSDRAGLSLSSSTTSTAPQGAKEQ